MRSSSERCNDLKFRFSDHINWLRVPEAIFVLLLIALTSCGSVITRPVISTGETITQQPEPLRPEPQEPHVIVSFYGLNENALGRLYFRTLSGDTPLTGSHPGNGEMRVVLPENQGVIYIVTAEAEGYVSSPISYTIQLSGTNFYLVEHGQITSNKVSNLKFQFKPIIIPTG
jgi:hypothetical protein